MRRKKLELLAESIGHKLKKQDFPEINARWMIGNCRSHAPIQYFRTLADVEKWLGENGASTEKDFRRASAAKAMVILASRLVDEGVFLNDFDAKTEMLGNYQKFSGRIDAIRDELRNQGKPKKQKMILRNGMRWPADLLARVDAYAVENGLAFSDAVRKLTGGHFRKEGT